MFNDILYPEQLAIIDILGLFSRDFYLAGDTAIALQLGHRKSIDFDLFSLTPIQNAKILRQLQSKGYQIQRILVDNLGEELTMIISGVKITFLYYPFQVQVTEIFEGMRLPDLSVLGAMKFYTLGRRSKWKDYVDIYFLMQSGHSLGELSQLATEIFAGGYNEKLLREQLCYYADIDFSEQVEYMGVTISDIDIQSYLTERAIGD